MKTKIKKFFTKDALYIIGTFINIAIIWNVCQAIIGPTADRIGIRKLAAAYGETWMYIIISFIAFAAIITCIACIYCLSLKRVASRKTQK